MLALAFELNDFLLRQQLVAAIRGHLIELLQPLDRLLHRHPIGEQAAQPALVNVKSAALGRLFGDRILRLTFGSHEQHNLAVGRQILHKLRRLLEHLQRLLQIDDVNSIALSENEFLHLGIPALRLMPEVNTRFEQLLHGDSSQSTSSFSLHRKINFQYRVPNRTCRFLDTGNWRMLSDCHSRPAFEAGRIEHQNQLPATSFLASSQKPKRLSFRPQAKRGAEESLALRELEALAGALLPVLLALFAARVASDQPLRLQLAAQFRIELH